MPPLLRSLRQPLVEAGLVALMAACAPHSAAHSAAEHPRFVENEQVGLIRNDPGASPGYTLFGTQFGPVFLIDNAGHMVHEWILQGGGLPKLLPNGQLMFKLRSKTIGMLDAAGEVLWRYEAPNTIHHDHEVLPNGNVLLLLRGPKSREEVLAAGGNPAFVGADGLKVDYLVEVQPLPPSGGEIVWRWSPWDHLVQDFDPNKPNYGDPADHPGRIDLNFVLERLSATRRVYSQHWLHANAIDYHAEADHILFLPRHFSELWVVDHSTTSEESAGSTGGRHGRGGELLWRWGNPRAHGAGTVADQRLFWPHAAHWIPAGLPGAGNILLFNNGDEFGDLRRDHSEVLELAYPLEDRRFGAWPAGEPQLPSAETWRYMADPPEAFLSLRASNAQRLGNGNTLIVSALRGTIFEVTPRGREVWRYVSPVVTGERQPRGYRVPFTYHDGHGVRMAANLLYRAFKHPSEYSGLKALDLTPKGTLALPPGSPPVAL